MELRDGFLIVFPNEVYYEMYILSLFIRGC